MQKRLDLLRAEADELQKKIKANRAKQVEIMIAMYKDKHKLTEGDTVQIDNTKIGVIIGFKADYDTIKPQVHLYKKNRTLGKRIESIWQHQKIVKVS